MVPANAIYTTVQGGDAKTQRRGTTGLSLRAMPPCNVTLRHTLGRRAVWGEPGRVWEGDAKGWDAGAGAVLYEGPRWVRLGGGGDLERRQSAPARSPWHAPGQPTTAQSDFAAV